MPGKFLTLASIFFASHTLQELGSKEEGQTGYTEHPAYGWG